jgi:hypothetical protein
MRKEQAPSIDDALKQCRDAIRDIALDLAIEQQNHLTNTLGSYRPHKHAAAAEETAKLRAALAAADTALAALSGPQDERAAFERWYFSLEEAMWYSGIQSAIAWNAWQARASLAHAPQPASALSAVREPHSMIAGALFDFAGFLTTRPTVTPFGSTADPCSAVDLLTQWAATRGLHLDEADVGGWSVGITDQAQQEGGQ